MCFVYRDILWSTVSPDALFLLSVLRCHFTVTIMIILIFCTKVNSRVFFPHTKTVERLF